LHDTVAHHVSAIAIQAQAGRTLAPNDPNAPLRSLNVIEKEATRTLTEMRTMVGVLRKGEPADMAPQPGVADITRLADGAGFPRVAVELSGQLDGLRPAVDAALFRLAQESITNARRHARHASNVVVRVRGDHVNVRLTVHDDGDTPPRPDDASGFGLAGMAERTRLLGGSFEAGPHPKRGWLVNASIPLDGDRT
jgi:signal transduction histidine kinase